MFRKLLRACLRVLSVSRSVSVGTFHPALAPSPRISTRYAIWDPNAGRYRACVSLDAAEPTDLVRITSEIR